MTDMELFQELRAWFLDSIRPAATYSPNEFARVRRLLDEIDDYNARQTKIIATATEERPVNKVELLSRLADFFASIIEDPSRLTAGECKEALLLEPAVSRFLTQGQGGPSDVRIYTKPSRN